MRSYINIVQQALYEDDAIDHGELLWKQFCRSAKLRPTPQISRLFAGISQIYGRISDYRCAAEPVEYTDHPVITKIVYTFNTEFWPKKEWICRFYINDAPHTSVLDKINPNVLSHYVHQVFGINITVDDINFIDQDESWGSELLDDYSELNIGGNFIMGYSAKIDHLLQTVSSSFQQASDNSYPLRKNWPQIQDYLTRTYT